MVQEVEATSIVTDSIALAPGEIAVYYTTNVASGTQTVLHAWDLGAQAEIAFGDGNSSTQAVIVFKNQSTATRTYLVVLRAENNSTHGTADLTRHWYYTYPAVPVGGSLVDVLTGQGYVYETAVPPPPTVGHPLATEVALIGLDADGHMVGFDAHGGVGLMARMATNGAKQVVVGALGGNEGLTRLYTNDTADDSDGDGLGTMLELALGTCDKAGQHGGFCWTDNKLTYNHHDSDRDGIEDIVEALGLDVQNGDDLLFPMWGADPDVKDIFVEVDWAPKTANYTTNPFGTLAGLQPSQQALIDWFNSVNIAFDPSTAFDMSHRESTQDRPVLHFDIGVAPVADANLTSFGDWGGANGANEPNRESAYSNHLDDARRPYFRYAWAWRGAGGGQAHNQRFNWNAGDPASASFDGNPWVFVHELGHTMGLHHWGIVEFDGGTMNCKPNYHSLMNYGMSAYPYFSSDDGAGPGAVFNNRALTEVDTLPAGYDSTLMSSLAYFGLLVSGSDIDWNRDGLLEPATRHGIANSRVGSSWASWDSCGAPLSSDILDDSWFRAQLDLAGGSALARIDDRLVAFFIQNGVLMYRTATLGPVADGSCVHGIGWDEFCVDWVGPFSVPTATANVSAVDAEPWGDGLAISFRGADSTAANDPNSLHVTMATGVLPSGILQGWQPRETIGTSARGAELSVINVDAAIHGEDQLLLAMWQSVPAQPDAASAARYTTTDADLLVPSVWSTVANVVDGQGSAIVVRRRPSVTPWPGRDVSTSFMGTSGACGVFPDAGDQNRFSVLSMYCLDPSSPSLAWTNVDSVFWASVPDDGTAHDPQLIYRHSRTPNGALEAPQYGLGEFWLSYVTEPGVAQVYMSGWAEDVNEPTSSTFDGFVRRLLTRDQWATPPADGGVFFYEDESLGSMFATFVTQAWIDGVGNVLSLSFFKGADGAIDLNMKTGNDFRVMERRMCSVLRGDTFCGGPPHTVHGY